MLPILDGLRAVHAKHFLHRDIKPQNIYLARIDSGGTRPVLLDFGAARQALGEPSRSLSVVVSAGYAPFEQYYRKDNQSPRVSCEPRNLRDGIAEPVSLRATRNAGVPPVGHQTEASRPGKDWWQHV
jgi:serine/threonine protein kinase